MNIEGIETFLKGKTITEESRVKITFKKGEAICVLFVRDKDFSELKSKNFWRVVTPSHLEEYGRSKNMRLAKIFSGTHFSRLALYKESLG